MAPLYTYAKNTLYTYNKGPAVAKYNMHYKMIVEDFPEELYTPTQTLLVNNRYAHKGFLYNDALVWDFTVYSISKRKIIALDLLYGGLILHSTVIEDAAIARVIGW